jgi:hypothetical protein
LDRGKLLSWGGDGYACFPVAADGATRLAIAATDLTMLLSGVDLTSVKRSQRYRRADLSKRVVPA